MLGAHALLAHRIAASLTVATGMLALAVVLVVGLIVRPARHGTARAFQPNGR